MRRPVLALAAVCAVLSLALPAAAPAQPVPPTPGAPVPALRGTPYLVPAGAGRVTLYVRLDRPLVRRFDGELGATALVDGRVASLAAVGGRHGLAAARAAAPAGAGGPRGGRAACYAAGVRGARARGGRLFAVPILFDDPAPPAAASTLVALRAARAGDERGAPLHC